jgi:hypothetical protein
MIPDHTTGVRFGRLERRGLLLGLTGVQLALVGCALMTVVSAGLIAGPSGLLLSAPAWAAALAWALVPVGGRPAVELTPTVLGWLGRRLTRSSTVIARPRTAAGPDVLAIPGLPGRLQITTDARTGAAVIRPARLATAMTVVAEVRGRGFLLEGAASQDRSVAGWGRLLASLAQMPGIAGVQVLHLCGPTPGRAIREWWASQDRTWSSRILTELAEETPAPTGVRSLIAVAFRPTRSGDDGVLASMTEAIDAAGLDLQTWMTPGQIRGAVRQSYDPMSVASAGTGSGPCGPMGVQESWSYLRTDSAVHAVYWVSEWPRSATHLGFLRPLLLAPGSPRTLSLLATPVPTGKALREIRRTRAEQTADAMTRARIGRVEDEATRAEAAELDRREEDLVAGHGDVRFTGLLTVTACTVEELAEDCAAAETAAAQAGCELRRLVGQQVQAFAAGALPLARLLP